MHLEMLFTLGNRVALLGWIVLVIAPRWRPASRAICGGAIPLLLAVAYIVLIVTRWPGQGGGFGSLAGVAQLFSDRGLLLAGWLHYLAFDLFIGAWEVRDATRRQVPHALVVPCLALTFLFGPAGLLLYFSVRSLAGRREPTTALAPAPAAFP